MGYIITEEELNAIVEFARKNPEYDFHTERIDEEEYYPVLSCIFIDKDDNNKIWELDGKEEYI